jgi:hypothetical protein
VAHHLLKKFVRYVLRVAVLVGMNAVNTNTWNTANDVLKRAIDAQKNVKKWQLKKYYSIAILQWGKGYKRPTSSSS